MPVTVTLDEISAFSKCPAYSNFLKFSTPVLPPRRTEIFTSVIQKCFIRHTTSGFRTDWRTIVGWVDKHVFKDVDIANTDSVEKGKIVAEHLLVALRSWYDKEYKKEICDGYADLEMKQNINKYQVLHLVPLIKLTDPPTGIIVSDVEMNATQMYNNMEVRGLAWLIARTLKIEKARILHYWIGPKGRFESAQLIVTKEANQSAENRIRQILMSIDADIKYPSITSMCNSCQFKPICHI